MAQPIQRSAPTAETEDRMTLITASHGAVSAMLHPLNEAHRARLMVRDVMRIGMIIDILEGDRPIPPTPAPRESDEARESRERLEQRAYVWDRAVEVYGSSGEALEALQRMQADLFTRLAIPDNIDDIFGLDEPVIQRLYEHLLRVNDRARTLEGIYGELYRPGTEARVAVLTLARELDTGELAEEEAPRQETELEVATAGAIFRPRSAMPPLNLVRSLASDTERLSYVQDPAGVDDTTIRAFMDESIEDEAERLGTATSQAQDLARELARAHTWVASHRGQGPSDLSRELGAEIARLMNLISHSGLRSSGDFDDAMQAFNEGRLQDGLDLLDGLQGLNTLRDYASTLWTLQISRNYVVVGAANFAVGYDWGGNSAVFENVIANRGDPSSPETLSPELLRVFLETSIRWGVAAGVLRQGGEVRGRADVDVLAVDVGASATMGWVSSGQPFMMTFRVTGGWRQFDAATPIPDSLEEVLGGEFSGGYLGITEIVLDVPGVATSPISLQTGVGVDFEGTFEGAHPSPYGYITVSGPVHRGDNVELRIFGTPALRYILNEIQVGVTGGIDITGRIRRDHILGGGASMEYRWNAQSGRHELIPSGRLRYEVMLDSVLSTLEFNLTGGAYIETPEQIDSITTPFFTGGVRMTFGGPGYYERMREAALADQAEEAARASRVAETARLSLVVPTPTDAARRAAAEEQEEDTTRLLQGEGGRALLVRVVQTDEGVTYLDMDRNVLRRVPREGADGVFDLLNSEDEVVLQGVRTVSRVRVEQEEPVETEEEE